MIESHDNAHFYERCCLKFARDRSSDPQTLITLAPILFERSVAAYETGLIGLDTLQGGLDYFQEPFLSYVLVPGVVGWLSEEIVFSGYVANFQLDLSHAYSFVA